MGLSTIVIVSVCLWAAVASYSQLQWSDCGSDPAVHINSITVSPMPVVVPGTIHLSINGHIGRSLVDFFDRVMICMGSTYDSPCPGTALLDRMINENWASMMGTIGRQLKPLLATITHGNTTCPQPPTDLNIQNFQLQLPPLPSVLNLLSSGDYKAHVVVRDLHTHHTMLCLDLALTVHRA